MVWPMSESEFLRGVGDFADIVYGMDVATYGEDITGYAVHCGPLIMAWCDSEAEAFAHMAKMGLAELLFGWLP